VNLATLLTRPLEVSTPGEPTEDPDYGTPVPGEPTTVTVLGYVEQVGTTEETVGQQTAPGTWWAALPAGTAVAATSTVAIPDSGQTFEVIGEPATRWSPWRERVEFVRVELRSHT
jgi:hypothetical protein